MRAAAVRLAPAVVAAAVPLTQTTCGRQRDEEGYQFLPIRQRVKSILHCEKLSSCRSADLKSAATGRSRKNVNDGTTKILLAGNRWIYRLVSSEGLKDYEFERELGKGGYGTVYLAKHKSMGYHRAVKKIPKSKIASENEYLMCEIHNMMDLDHPHIIKLARTHTDDQHIYIVQELCSGPDLFDRIVDGKPMTEHEAAVALRHMLKAVQCCHSHYKGHYDIKPENFMFSDPDCKTLKMIDLGMSSGFTEDPDTFKGTVDYMAPEVFFGMYGPPADIWGCGVVLFAMLTRDSFVDGIPEDKLADSLQDRRWLNGRLSAASEKVSAECADLMRRMLCCDRHMRISAEAALKHPFIENSYSNEKGQQKGLTTHHSHGNHGPDRRQSALKVISSMVDSFAEFGEEPVLVRAALLVMVHTAGYIAEVTQRHRLAYSMLDRAGSGELSMDSIEAMLPHYGSSIPANFGDTFRELDLRGTGYINFSSFLAATFPDRLRCREDLCRRAFYLLDRNKDGYLDEDDLLSTFFSEEKVVRSSHRELCRKAIIEASGSSGKVRLDFDAFFHIVLGGRSPIVGPWAEGALP